MSNVHICLKDILGVAVKCEVIFYPGDTPFQNGTALAVSGRRSLWLGDDGTGSATLAAGRYTVRFGGLTGNTDTLIIEVPNDGATYELTALICAGNWIVPYRDFLQGAKNLADVADAGAAFGNIKQPATTAATGVVALATVAEVNAGADAAKVVTPATLVARGYQTKAAAFTATQSGRYALDTSAGGFSVTIDAALPVGGFIDFADAFGTWNTNPPTFLRNGFLLEGAEVHYVDSAQGTFLRILNMGGAVGLRILEAGTKPHNLTLPTVTGQYIGQKFTSNVGTWTGAPTGYIYQWQSSTDGSTWTDISAATASAFTPDAGLLGAYVRLMVSASNANGTSLPVASAASAALAQAPYPPGVVAAYHFDSAANLLVDSTGNGHTLSNNNGVTCVAGKLGNAAQGDGNSYLSGKLPLTAASGITMAFWAKLTDTEANYPEALKLIDSNGSGVVEVYPFHPNFNGALGTGQNGFDVSIATAHDTAVRFFAFVYNAEADTGTFYVNDGSATGSGTLPGDPSSISVLVNAMVGWVDELVIWNRALSSTEISRLYNNGNGLAYPA